MQEKRHRWSATLWSYEAMHYENIFTLTYVGVVRLPKDITSRDQRTKLATERLASCVYPTAVRKRRLVPCITEESLVKG